MDNAVPPEQVHVESRGRRWTVYWVLEAASERCFMTEGTRTFEVVNPHELQELHMEASILGDEAAACDLACERLKLLLEARDSSSGLLPPL